MRIAGKDDTLGAEERMKRVWCTALAGLVHVALVSAAIETFVAGSPVRWPVAGVVGLYIAAIIGLPRLLPRLRDLATPAVLASCGGEVLLGVLALTAWLPAGVGSGLRVFGQSTSTVLTLITTVCVAMAGVTLVRSALLPRWAQVGLGAMALYGAVALAVGVAEGTPFGTLLQGESLWRRLPIWMQGAFVGALLLVPLAVLVDAIALLQRRQAVAVGRPLRRMLALALSVTIAVPAATVQNVTAAGPSLIPRPASAAPGLTTAERLAPVTQAATELREALHGATEQLSSAERGDRLKTTFDDMSQLMDRIPRDSFEPGSVQASVGRDPERLLEWVATHTAYVPYRGVLRGSSGVLMDRFGNSLDRSLLLADLLKRAGREVRLAHASLSPEDVTRVYSRLGQREAAPPRAEHGTDTAGLDVLRAYAKKVGGRPDSVPEAATRMQRAAETFQSDVIARSAAQANALRQIAGRSLDGVPERWASLDRDAIADHWWVQMREGDGWIDLDPLRDAWTGGPAPVAQSTMLPGDLEEDAYQRVRISLGIECACGHGIEERPVFNRTFRVADVSGTAIVFKQGPASEPPADVLAATSPEPVVTWLTSPQDWVPGLVIGSRTLEISGISTAGVVASPQAKGASVPGAGLLDAFGGDEPAAEAAGQLTAEFLDYEISIPGQEPRTERRYLVDWLGQSARAAHPDVVPVQEWASRRPELAMQVEILVMGAQPSPEFVAFRAGRSALAQREGMMRLLRELDRPSAAILENAEPPADPFPFELFQLAGARRALGPQTRSIYLAEPNIVTKHEGWAIASDGAPALLDAFDIVANAVRVRPGAGQDPVMVALIQGVADAHAELAVASADVPSENIAELEMSGVDANQWHVERVQGPHLLISPAQSNSATWVMGGAWRVDVSRANVLAMTSRGWGGTQDMHEFGFQNAEMAARSMKFIGKMFATIVCIATVTTKGLIEKDKEKFASPRMDRVEAGTVIGIVSCLIAGYSSGIGGMMKGATGQMVGFMGDMYSLGGALVALYNLIGTWLGGANIASHK